MNFNRQFDFIKDLNQQQREAVETIEGPLLVVAGAGSGKTRTIVYRVARLIEAGIDPSAILLLTFTRKAAAVMLNRAAALVGSSCHDVEGGTFHSFSHRMLRQYARYAGYPANFTIMDRNDVQDLLYLLARELKLTELKNKLPKRSTLASMFSRMINSNMDVYHLMQKHYSHLEELAPKMDLLFSTYANYKKKHALMDYDDLLNIWRDILAENPEVRQAAGHRFNYIMVDEYQDTNTAQAEIIKFAAEEHGNVMAVGDDAQSIYAFRGATVRNIFDFPKLFPGTKIIKLEKNYRATQPNLDCTNNLIANAREKFTKLLVAQRKGGIKPVLYMAVDEQEQSEYITRQIMYHLGEGIEPSEIAVLFRAGFHSYSLETSLNRQGINFEKRGGIKLVESAHIKDLLSVLRVCENPLDKVSFNRIVKLIYGIGSKTADKIFVELCKPDSGIASLINWKSRSRWAEEIRETGRLLNKLADLKDDLDKVFELTMEWYQPYLEKLYPENYPSRMQDLEQLRALADRYDDVSSILADLTIDPMENSNETSGKIVLSTMHSAKGLEWKTVFVISLAEGRMPSPASSKHAHDIEEERRLLYVAATRAKDFLYFCYPSFINLSGAGLMPAQPSRFLQEIPETLFDIKSGAAAFESTRNDYCFSESSSEMESVYSADSSSSCSFNIGDRVRHSLFGKGTVTRIIDPLKLKVDFDVGGVKTLRIDFAPLSLIN